MCASIATLSHMTLIWVLTAWPRRALFSIHAYSFLEYPALDSRPWFILKYPWELWELMLVVSLSGLQEIQRTAQACPAYILVRCASRCVLETVDMWVNKLNIEHLWGMWETLTNRLGSKGKDHHRWNLPHVRVLFIALWCCLLVHLGFCLFAYALTCRQQTPDPSAFERFSKELPDLSPQTGLHHLSLLLWDRQLLGWSATGFPSSPTCKRLLWSCVTFDMLANLINHCL